MKLRFLIGQLLMSASAAVLAVVVVYWPDVGFLLILGIGIIVILLAWRRIFVRALNGMCKCGPNGPDQFK